MTTEELDAIDALRAEYVAACESELKALAIRVENNRGMKYRAMALGKAHAALNDAGVRLARDASDLFPRLLAQARQVESLRAKLAESETARTELRQELDAVKGRLRAIGQILSDHGCDCDCGCDGDGHVCDGPVCFPCQVEAAMKGATR